MDFLEAVNQGLAKATAADQATRDVNDAFQKVNSSLEMYPLATISIERGTVSNLFDSLSKFQESMNNNTPEYLSYNTIFLVAKHREGDGRERKKIAAWKQHVNGFPCTISYEGEKQTCYSGEDLTASFGELFSSVSFGKALLELLANPAVGGEPGEI
ncbi:hypothetical protein KVG88_06480 [Pseudomonas sp. SWRI74]|uniref:Uncharacterized protein n=1 Tax=Pseudomonas azerbaijanoccidentalis TaxID=2842347 RepID=A0ABS6QL82_9PSED|nr:hypothetical protein [Pseudomonas azerbaijanoccidentalis]MBV4519703.1 hypothetical protein [Pseudomonas azerbaijanoccidentalis]